MYLVGDFNNWKMTSKCKKKENGIFELFLPDVNGKYFFSIPCLSRRVIPHLSKIKIVIVIKDKVSGKSMSLYRVPSHIHYAIPDPLGIQFVILIDCR